MTGTFINVIAILSGGAIGLLFHQKTQKNFGERIMEGFGIFVLVIGIKGALVGDSSLLYIISLILGAILGEALRLDDKLKGFTGMLEDRFSKGKNENFKEGFISTTILFCIGAMAIVGPLNAVLKGNNDILYIKSALDGVTAFIFASNFGISVLLSGLSVLIYQGSISLLAYFFKDFLSLEVINAMSVIGSLLVAAIGINMLNLGNKKINVVNLLPAVFIPLLWGPVSLLIAYLKDVL